jgi:hypothetical protein
MTPVLARTCSPCQRKIIFSGGGTGYKPAPAKRKTRRGRTRRCAPTTYHNDNNDAVGARLAYALSRVCASQR